MKATAISSVCGALVLGAVVGALGACREPGDDPREHQAASAQMKPFLDRLAAIRDGLPPPGTEQEVPCGAAIPEQGLEAGDLMALEDFLGKDQPPEIDRNRVQWMLSWGSNGSMAALSARFDGPNQAAINIRRAAEHWATIDHVMVFRATERDLGEIGDTDESGAYVIERPARWRGWAFVYAFRDQPELVMAFPLQRVSEDEMQMSVRVGYRPELTALYSPVVLGLRREAFERLARCPAPAAGGAPLDGDPASS